MKIVDWAELTIKVKSLMKQRDGLLNDKKYLEAFHINNEILKVNLDLSSFLLGKI